jgi:hypothetical protein
VPLEKPTSAGHVLSLEEQVRSRLCERVKMDQLLTEKIGGIQDDVQRRYKSLRVRRELKACLSRG